MLCLRIGSKRVKHWLVTLRRQPSALSSYSHISDFCRLPSRPSWAGGIRRLCQPWIARRQLPARSHSSGTESHTGSPDASQQLCGGLAAGEVHVWWLFPAEASKNQMLDQYQALLSKEEQIYVSEGSSTLIKQERLLTRALVRSTLARYCPSSSQPLEFCKTPYGKPLLKDSTASLAGRVQFNITHTPSLIGCAVASDARVGLDVELADRKMRTANAPHKFLSPAELSYLEGVQAPEARARHFIRLWTLKEAYVKATGRGILAAPGMAAFSIDVQVLQEEHHCMSQSGVIRLDGVSNDDARWAFVLFQLRGEHVGALCIDHQALHLSQVKPASQMPDNQIAGAQSRTPSFPLRMWTTVPGVKDDVMADFQVLAVTPKPIGC